MIVRICETVEYELEVPDQAPRQAAALARSRFLAVSSEQQWKLAVGSSERGFHVLNTAGETEESFDEDEFSGEEETHGPLHSA